MIKFNYLHDFTSDNVFYIFHCSNSQSVMSLFSVLGDSLPVFCTSHLFSFVFPRYCVVVLQFCRNLFSCLHFEKQVLSLSRLVAYFE